GGSGRDRLGRGAAGGAGGARSVAADRWTAAGGDGDQGTTPTVAPWGRQPVRPGGWWVGRAVGPGLRPRGGTVAGGDPERERCRRGRPVPHRLVGDAAERARAPGGLRSEERRVGKEGRSGRQRRERSRWAVG